MLFDGVAKFYGEFSKLVFRSLSVWFTAKLPNLAANFFDSSFGVGGHCKSLVQLIPSEKYTAYCMSEPAGGPFRAKSSYSRDSRRLRVAT